MAGYGELSTGTWTCHCLPVVGEHLNSVLYVTCGGAPQRAVAGDEGVVDAAVVVAQ